MSKHSIISLSIFLLLIFSSNLRCFELTTGVTPESERWDALTKTDYDAGYYPKAVVETEQDGVVFVYDGSLGKTNYIEGRLIGGWELGVYPAATIMAGELPSAVDILQGAGVYEKIYDNRYWKVNEPSELKTGPDVVWENRYRVIDREEQYGCLAQHPLRYGDVDGGGAEVILFSGNSIIFFSPTTEQVVFSFNWLNSDEVDEFKLSEIKAPESDHRLHTKYKSLGDNAPQYVAASSEDKFVDNIFPAWRSFAKIYFGDFNDDKRSDVVMWRRLYESRLVVDEEKGFIKKAEVLVHYSLVDEKYQLQDTEQATIQQWMGENELTWQKGFPSSSECLGEEGKPIAEMHDPLLNDPDVLK